MSSSDHTNSSGASTALDASAAVQSTAAQSTTAESSSSSSALDLPAHNSIYKRKEYWEERFSKEEHYEWLSGQAHRAGNIAIAQASLCGLDCQLICLIALPGYAAVRDLLRPLLKPEHKILHLGCGNSDLSRDLYLDGYHNITNIDFSSACIAAQRTRNEKDCPEMTWLVQDMMELDFPTSSFDIVLDKCTLDALVVNEGDPWDPSDEVRSQVDKVLTGVSRVLKPDGGLYLQMSFGQPIHRLNNYFEKEKYAWEVSVSNWGQEQGFGYFFYTHRRVHTPSDLSKLSEYYREKARRLAEDEERVRALAEQQRLTHESDDEHDEERMMAMDL